MTTSASNSAAYPPIWAYNSNSSADDSFHRNGFTPAVSSNRQVIGLPPRREIYQHPPPAFPAFPTFPPFQRTVPRSVATPPNFAWLLQLPVRTSAAVPDFPAVSALKPFAWPQPWKVPQVMSYDKFADVNFAPWDRDWKVTLSPVELQQSCRSKCTTVSVICWPLPLAFLVALIALLTYKRRMYRRYNECPSQEKETIAIKKREERLREAFAEGTDLQDSTRQTKLLKEISAITDVAAQYRTLSRKRNYLGQKTVANTVVEISRAHPELRLAAMLAGSTQEGLGDTLQGIQNIHEHSSICCGRRQDVEEGRCQDYVKRPCFSSDIDVMVWPLSDAVGPTGTFEAEPIETRQPGYVRLKLRRHSAETLTSSLSECLDDSGSFLSAAKVKRLLRTALASAEGVFCGPSVSVCSEVHGVAMQMKWAESSAIGFFETVAIADFTFALRVPDWPDCAKLWASRCRNWPSADAVSEIVSSGCHVVAFDKGVAAGDRSLWRLSFSKPELALANALPKGAKDMYVALRALFKCHIQPSCPLLSSYHLKTAVLWQMEDLPSDFFSSHPRAAAAGLVRVLGRMYSSIHSGSMPHYFVEDHNILPALSKDEIKAAKDALLDASYYASLHLENLRADETFYMPANDPMLITLPDELCEEDKKKETPRSVIWQQLRNIMSDIPDLNAEQPVVVPAEPVYVHLLTGRFVKLPSNLELMNQEHAKILSALEDEAKAASRRCCTSLRMALFYEQLGEGMMAGKVYSLIGPESIPTPFGVSLKVHRAVRSSILLCSILFCSLTFTAVMVTSLVCKLECSPNQDVNTFDTGNTNSQDNFHNVGILGRGEGPYYASGSASIEDSLFSGFGRGRPFIIKG